MTERRDSIGSRPKAPPQGCRQGDDGDELPIIVLPDDLDFDASELTDEASELVTAAAQRVAAGLRDPARMAALADAAGIEEITAEPFQYEEIVDENFVHDLEEEISQDTGSEKFSLPRAYIYVACCSAVLLSVLLYVGWNYYRSPLLLRHFHHLHSLLRPSGYIGLPLGILGTALILVSLLYLVRKHRASWRSRGSLAHWMGFHIFTGLLGPIFVVFHAAFVPYSAFGILASASMAVVLCTGILGKFIYVRCPRSLEGRELEFEVVRRRLVVYRQKLIGLGINPKIIDLDARSAGRRRNPWLITAIVRVLLGDRERKRELKRFLENVANNADLRARAHRILPLVRRLCRERQWLVRYAELRKIMGAWRFFHRWLAIIMLVAVFFHVFLGVRFGELWIFGGHR